MKEYAKGGRDSIEELLRLTFDDDVKAAFTVYRSGTNIAERPEIETREKRLASTKQNRPDD